MLRIRIIPTLLIKNGNLVKGINFQNHRYVGDPMNAVKIFAEKGVDEIILLDISDDNEKEISADLIRGIADECFIPFSVGGKINSIKRCKELLNNGVEKVVINTAAYVNPNFIAGISKKLGSQSVSISIDVKKNGSKYEMYINCGKTKIDTDPVIFAKKMVNLGAGEIIITSIDREGTMQGYDLDIIRNISQAVSVPVIASGGAGNLNHMRSAIIDAGAHAVAASSMFVFWGKNKAVLINYPNNNDRESLFNRN